MVVAVRTAGEDILDVESGIEMLSSLRRAEVLNSMGPLPPWFHLPRVLLPLTPCPIIRKPQKTSMSVAVKLDDVAFSGRIAGQARTAAATHQGRPLYEVMSVTLNNYPHIKNGTDTGASETMRRWAWSEHGRIRLNNS